MESGTRLYSAFTRVWRRGCKFSQQKQRKNNKILILMFTLWNPPYPERGWRNKHLWTLDNESLTRLEKHTKKMSFFLSLKKKKKKERKKLHPFCSELFVCIFPGCKCNNLLSLWFLLWLYFMFTTVCLVFKVYVCNFACLMLGLCSYKTSGLLCGWLYSASNVLRCQVNKPCLNQLKKKKNRNNVEMKKKSLTSQLCHRVCLCRLCQYKTIFLLASSASPKYWSERKLIK